MAAGVGATWSPSGRRRKGKAQNCLTPCLLRILPSKRLIPPEVARMSSQGLIFQQVRLRSIVAFLLLFFPPSKSHFQVSVTRKERFLLGKQSADCHISESLHPSLQCFVEAISNSWWLASRNKHQCTYQYAECATSCYLSRCLSTILSYDFVTYTRTDSVCCEYSLGSDFSRARRDLRFLQGLHVLMPEEPFRYRK